MPLAMLFYYVEKKNLIIFSFIRKKKKLHGLKKKKSPKLISLSMHEILFWMAGSLTGSLIVLGHSVSPNLSVLQSPCYPLLKIKGSVWESSLNCSLSARLKLYQVLQCGFPHREGFSKPGQMQTKESMKTKKQFNLLMISCTSPTDY